MSTLFQQRLRARRPIRPLLAAIYLSLMFHAYGVLAAAILWEKVFARLQTPPHGVNSIEIQASLSTRPSQVNEDGQPDSNPPPSMFISVEKPRPQGIPQRDNQQPAARQTVRAVVVSDRPYNLDFEPRAATQPTEPPGERNGRLTDDARPVIASRQTPVVKRSKMSNDLPAEVLEIARASTPPSVASQEQRGVQSDTLPMKAFYPKPLYPPELEARGIGGLVKLRVRVGAGGRVKAAAVFRTSGYRAFDRAALDVIDRWRFEPARRAGSAVEMTVLVPIRFRIEQP